MLSLSKPHPLPCWCPARKHRADRHERERAKKSYAGKGNAIPCASTPSLPFWLAPCQIVVANISEGQIEYAEEITIILRNNGFRVESDLRNENIGYKIREHSNAKVPVILAVGKKEADEQTVSVRRLGSQQTSTIKLDKLIKDLQKESLSPIN